MHRSIIAVSRLTTPLTIDRVPFAVSCPVVSGPNWSCGVSLSDLLFWGALICGVVALSSILLLALTG